MNLQDIGISCNDFIYSCRRAIAEIMKFRELVLVVSSSALSRLPFCVGIDAHKLEFSAESYPEDLEPIQVFGRPVYLLENYTGLEPVITTALLHRNIPENAPDNTLAIWRFGVYPPARAGLRAYRVAQERLTSLDILVVKHGEGISNTSFTVREATPLDIACSRSEVESRISSLLGTHEMSPEAPELDEYLKSLRRMEE